ncbi:uncharacterized protein LOC127255377 [Andrographis paniculata]|uniref:uncharacterized protein LOC127255377 n=1 Tax=Andrographis paniculata TaxID=175694 RepID=UPI0021E93D63|nr:uncharacterized protein LOC127255377 [Andrographis paniculata]
MSTTAAAAACRLGCSIHFSLVKQRNRNCSSGVRCSTLPQRRSGESRRAVSLSLVLLHFAAQSKEAMSAGIFDKYMKKKKLDPLESYVPAVLLTELQIEELGQYLEVDQPKFADCRSLLRSGPASSLRVNIRAVAQYASEAGNGKSAFDEVDQCLRALEELDSLLLRASRNESETSVETMKGKVVTALNALDSLLKTVPSEVLDKGKAMAEMYLSPRDDDSSRAQDLDPQLKQLESIL